MAPKLERTDTGIIVEGKPVAEVHRDYKGHINEVMLHADASDELQTLVLRSLVLYVHQYVMKLSPEQIVGLDRAGLEKQLKALGIDVSVAFYKDVQEAIDAAIKKVGVPSLRYAPVQTHTTSNDKLRLEFTVEEPNSFTFWKSESRPQGNDDLHIVPSYHPAMNGWKEVGLVNGDTDYYIRGKTVAHFYCPTEAQTGKDLQYKSSSWGHLKHPFRAEGQDMQLEVDTTKMRSTEGVDELAEVLRASLGLDKTYVAISGGFQPPMKCPNNRLLEIKRKSPYPRADHSGRGHVARGSESHCVWAYRTLLEEGVLDKSYVPAWFKQEGWLEIYEGAAVEPGVY